MPAPDPTLDPQRLARARADLLAGLAMVLAGVACAVLGLAALAPFASLGPDWLGMAAWAVAPFLLLCGLLSALGGGAALARARWRRR